MYFRQVGIDEAEVLEDIASLETQDGAAPVEEGPATAADMSYYESEHSPWAIIETGIQQPPDSPANTAQSQPCVARQHVSSV